MASRRNRSRAGADEISRPRDRRRTPLSYIVFSLFVTLLGVGVAVGGLLLYGQKRFEARGPLTETRNVVVKSGQGVSEIAATLEREGIISNKRIFQIASGIYQKLGRTLKAGEYSFAPGESMQKVFDKISNGKSLAYKVTIPEGWTTQQALQRITANDILTGDAPSGVPEGVLLPNTYSFERGETRDVVVERMRRAQQQLIDKLWDQRSPNLPIQTKKKR